MKERETITAPTLLQYHTITTPTGGGFNTYVSAEKIDDSESPDISNLILSKEALWVDSGYSAFGQPVAGVGQGSCQLTNTLGDTFTLLITTASAYVWDDPASQWTYASASAPTEVTVAANINATSLQVASTAGIVSGTPIAVMGVTGKWMFLTVQGAPVGSTINFTPKLTDNVAANASVVMGISLNGHQPYRAKFAPWAANGWLIFSNGVDPVMYYDGAYIHTLPGLPPNTTARAMAVFHEQLLLANLVENGTTYPYRLRSSDQADPTNWTTGLAAVVDLIDTDDEIYQLELLGPWIIMYRAATIMRISYLGLPLETLFVEYMVGTGKNEETEAAIGYGAVANCGDFHVFIGEDNIYEYRGDYTYTPIGHQIRCSFLGPFGKLNEAQKKIVFAFYLETTYEVWIFLPTINNNVPNLMLRYRADSKRWMVRTFANAMGAYGMYSATSGVAWNQLVGPWNAQTWTWASQAVGEGVTYPLLMDAQTGQVYAYDFLSHTDNGLAIPWYYVTKAFGSETSKSRLNRLSAYGQAANVNVSYRLTVGMPWTPMGTLSVASQKGDLWMQTVFDYIQFMFSGTDPSFQLHWINVEDLPESLW